MRTTVTLEPSLLNEASKLTGVVNKSDLVNTALAVLVRVEAARRLAALGGSDPQAVAAPRHRSDAR